MLRSSIPIARALARRELHTTSRRSVVTSFTMPAMSPTMTEGGIAAWKVEPGQAFSAGDVLLEIETDKATMDVEAPEDGVMAKIVVNAGEKAVQVGRVIAMLAEEGDDISNVQVPNDDVAGSSSATGAQPAEQYKMEKESKETPSKPPASGLAKADASRAEAAPSSSFASAAAHSGEQRMFPSVARLLQEHNDVDVKSVKGTGVRGMLTKGDVLAHLGLAKGPSGTATKSVHGVAELGGPPAAGGPKAAKDAPAKPQEPLTPAALRSLIFGGLASSSSSHRARNPQPAPALEAAQQASKRAAPKRDILDELLGDYEFGAKAGSKSAGAAKKDGFAGLV